MSGGVCGGAVQEADTDDNQGTLGFEEFCSFYKMMSTRRDLYLLMLTYSNLKDHLDADDLTRFLQNEQKVFVISTCTGKFETATKKDGYDIPASCQVEDFSKSVAELQLKNSNCSGINRSKYCCGTLSF